MVMKLGGMLKKVAFNNYAVSSVFSTLILKLAFRDQPSSTYEYFCLL